MQLPSLCFLLMVAIIPAPLPGQTPPSPPVAGPMVEAQPLPLEELTSAPGVSEASLPPTVGPPLPMPALPADGYWVEAAPLNEVFQYLARKASLQYFYNNTIATPEYQLTGHLRFDEPVQQMEDVALVFGLTVYRQGSTVFAMTEQQLAKLPMEVMSYPLKYLRGSRPGRSSSGGAAPAAGAEGQESGGGLADFEKLKAIMKPMLTKAVGQIEFEEKTNTLLVTDNSLKLKKLRELLEKIDRPKQQIAVNVRVLRVSDTHGKKAGVDWSALGNGISLSTSQSLNALFNLPDTSVLNRANTITQTRVEELDTRSVESITTQNSLFQDGPGLVFGPLQVQAIIRALENQDLVSQEACPTIITEDNEQGIISIVDRFPIITSSVSETGAGLNTADQVRYKIDEKDPDAMETPEKSREIGVTLSVTPTLLPDGTVRMKLRPRVAKIVELVPGRNGTFYPRVSESTAEAISRIPSGKSLILGGFYDYSTIDTARKIPFFGNIPIVGRAFKYKEKSAQKVSLVFIITPTVYDASSSGELELVNEDTRILSGLGNSELDIVRSPSHPPQSVEPWVQSAKTTINVIPQPPARKTSWLKRVFTRQPRPQPSPVSQTVPGARHPVRDR